MRPAMLQHLSERFAILAGFVPVVTGSSGAIRQAHSVSQAPPTAQAQPAAAADARPYFVEFRVATIGTYSHSYAVYGSASRVKYADLHPMGGYAVMAIG